MFTLYFSQAVNKGSASYEALAYPFLCVLYLSVWLLLGSSNFSVYIFQNCAAITEIPVRLGNDLEAHVPYGDATTNAAQSHPIGGFFIQHQALP